MIGVFGTLNRVCNYCRHSKMCKHCPSEYRTQAKMVNQCEGFECVEVACSTPEYEAEVIKTVTEEYRLVKEDGSS